MASTTNITMTEDAVHQRRLAHVRAPHDRHHRQRGQQLDAVLPEAEAFEHRGIVIVELVVRQRRTQRLGALLGERVVDLGEALGQVVRATLVLVFSAHSRSSSSRARCSVLRAPAR
jgi:hypothetical protein